MSKLSSTTIVFTQMTFTKLACIINIMSYLINLQVKTFMNKLQNQRTQKEGIDIFTL